MTACATCGSALPDGARFCPSCGSPVAEAAPVVEERKLATVLFADLVGSTALAGDSDPERVRVLQDSFFDALTDEIERTGGTVEKFAGDAVMAAFGAPAALEDHAERALHAALAMRERIEELFDGALRLRIGVNTGDVVVGAPREGSSFVTGDAVNVSARLEQAAEPGEILAGERTVVAAGGAFEFGESRVVVAKGKPDGLRCSPVLRSLSLARPRRASALRHAFVGRDAELDLLGATFRRASAQGEPHLVTIFGEPGVGKSTLVRKLSEALAAEDPAPLWRTGRCLPYGDGITYWPLGEMLREHFGIREGEDPEEVLGKLPGRSILALALGLDVAGQLHPLDAREQLHVAAVGFLQELASDRPAVALVEDIHWAEDDLLDLLDRAIREAQAPIVVIATARPELLDRRRSWGAGRRNAAAIWLEPLPPDASARMLDELLAGAASDDLRDLVVQRAEGNPFFLEELVGALIDEGVLERRNGSWIAGDVPEGFSVPDSLHAVLAARIDRLPRREKEALQAAAIVGRVFWRGPVVALLGEEPDLDLLEERDFIRRRNTSSMPGEREYGIKHALTREVAYAGIPKARRGRLHAALAEWLEGSEATRDEHAPLLAYHYAEAVRPEDADLVWASDPEQHERLRARAVVWLRRAAELARSRFEMDEAVELFMRAASLSIDDHERALLWREAGTAQALRYDGEGFWAAMGRALEGPLEPPERAETYATLAFQTSIRSGMWKTRPTGLQIKDWADRALELGGDDDVVRLQAYLANAHNTPADEPEAFYEELGELAERIGDVNLQSYTYAARSHAAFDRLRFDEAAMWSERRLGLVPAIDDPDGLCEVYESAVPVASAQGRFDQARDLARRHLEIARRLSSHHLVHAVSLAAEVADAVGDWKAIERETARVTDAVAENAATPCVRNARDLYLCALAHLCEGQEDRARELERDAAMIAGEGHGGELSHPRLQMALLRGDLEAVRRQLDMPPERVWVWGVGVYGARLDGLVALRAWDEIERDAPARAVQGSTLEPFALRALGAARGDDDLLVRADAGFRAFGLDWHAAQTERLLAGT